MICDTFFSDGKHEEAWRCSDIRWRLGDVRAEENGIKERSDGKLIYFGRVLRTCGTRFGRTWLRHSVFWICIDQKQEFGVS